MALPDKKIDRRWFFAIAVLPALLIAFAGFWALRFSCRMMVNEFFYPYFKLAKVATGELSEQSLLLFSREELARKIESLRAENRNAALDKLRAENLARENEALRRLWRMPRIVKWDYFPAEVMSRDPIFWKESLSIAFGRDDVGRIRPGAAVLAPDERGLPMFVGVVSEVGENTARVDTLFSPSLRMSVEFRSVHGVGVLNAGERRGASGAVPVGYLMAHLSYPLGEKAYTTGFEQGIPRGVSVGKLVEVEEIDPRFGSELHLSGLIRPDADFDMLKFLVVAVPESVAAAPAENL